MCAYLPVMGLLCSFPGIQVRRTLRAAGSDKSRSMGGSGRAEERQDTALLVSDTQKHACICRHVEEPFFI